MAQLIAPSVNEITSDPFTLTDGQDTTIFFTSADGSVPSYATATLLAVNSVGTYTPVGALFAKDNGWVLSGKGTYRIKKPASPYGAFGVDRN